MVLVVFIIIAFALLMFFTFALEDQNVHSEKAELVDLWSFQGYDRNAPLGVANGWRTASAPKIQMIALFKTEEGKEIQLNHDNIVDKSLLGKTGRIVYKKGKLKRFEIESSSGGN
jgi:hypothetical protein